MKHPLLGLLTTMLALAAAMCGPSPQAESLSPPSPPPNSTSTEDGFSFARVPATEPADAEKTFRTLHGFRMDLLAAEPLVTDPVALEYDENGLAWVVEMCDYPYTDKSTDKPNVERTTDAPLGRIRILEDTDGDGRFDRSDIFAEELSWPTGIALWKGGCYVTATPDVWYLKDTDGDRKADVRRKVFTGFKKLNVQAVMNNLRWGLDHKLYAAGASNGGEITKPDDPEFKPVKFGRADFSFDPHTENFEVLAGGARFGQTFDDWGNRFLCNIRNPVQHVVIENRYLARNPYLPPVNVVHDVAEAGDTLPVYRVSPPEPWRTARAERWRAEAGQTYPRSELAGEGYFTSSSGITIYRGAAYPKEFYGNAFVSDVAGNLVHRQVLVPDGVTFKSHRGDENAEFVASTDNWFRPVNFTNAPDGTLHVCDMYRETIEHPWSIPDDMKPYLDLESGRDRGRIYRLAPPNFTPPTARPQLGKATAAELVATLENPNSWWRDTAHRLIYERRDKACIEPLRKMLWESKSELGRLHALWSLEGLKALDQEDLLKALHDATNGVRRHGIKLAESRLDQMPIVLRRVRNMGADADLQSRDICIEVQVALSLGETADVGATDHLAWQLMSSYAHEQDAGSISNVLFDLAVYSSAYGREVDILLSESSGMSSPVEWHLKRANPLAEMVGVEGKPANVIRLVQAAFKDREHPNVALVASLAQGLQRSRKSLVQFDYDVETEKALSALFRSSSKGALDERQKAEDRIGFLRLLAQGPFSEANTVLSVLLDPRQPVPLQIEAVRTLAGFPDATVPGLLLKNYKTLTPSVRTEIVEALASRPDRVSALLDAVENKIVAAADIPQARRALLMKSKDAALAERAVKLLTQSTGARKAVIDEYRPALKLPADATRGHVVFARECKACHKLRGEGFDIGPNLATILHRSPDELLTHILDPNREVSPNFLEYVVELDDGRTVTGLIGEETAAGLVIRKAENVQESILRRNIDAMYATGKSLMPEGLEKKITPQEAADLLAFLFKRG